MSTKHAFGCILLVTGLIAQQADAQSNTPVVLKGIDYAFSISVPADWSLDTTDRAGRAAARAVLYFMEQGKLSGEIGILIATKKVEGKNTLPHLLSYSAHIDSIHGAKSAGPPQTLWTKDKKKAILVTSISGNSPSYTAYIDDANIVAVIATWQMGQNVLDKGLAVLKEVVQSYSSVSTPKGQ